MTREEAIKVVKRTKGTLVYTEKEKEALETLIPELAESEDERIRKSLVEYFSKFNPADMWDNSYSFSQILAYLEKQKEPSVSAIEVLERAGLKPYKDGDQWCILAGDNIQEGIYGFGGTIGEALYQFLMEVLEKQKEQNVVPSRETILGIWELGNLWKENPEERNGLTQLQYIQKYWFEKCDYLKEQKPAEWSEEDEELWADIKRRMINVTFIASDKIAWLENKLNSFSGRLNKVTDE